MSVSKYKELRDRIIFTIGALIVYRIGTYVPIPGVDPEVFRGFLNKNSGGLLGVFEMFSGGAFGRMAVFALGITPYISASISMQLLTSAIPYLEELKKDGEAGRDVINKYTRYLAIVTTLIQSYFISKFVSSIQIDGKSAVFVGSYFPYIVMPTMLGGTLFLSWLGDHVTNRGIGGNGTTLIIWCGIISNLPASIFRLFELGRVGSLSFITVIVLAVAVSLVVLLVVAVERAQRRILIDYPRSMNYGKSDFGGSQHLPLKINSAGVMPPIFGLMFLSLPVTLVNIGLAKGEVMGWAASMLTHGTALYVGLLSVFIMFFSFFYVPIVYDTEKVATDLAKGGAFLPGIRPGTQTAQYLSYVLNRLTFVGGVYLVLLCAFPEFLIGYYSLPFYIGGTSILIVVDVTVNLVTQIKTHLMSHQYRGLVRRTKK